MSKLHLATFNIRCFGFNGDYSRKKPFESRINTLKEFISKYLTPVDLFVFQEIMDPSLLQKILPEDLKISTYQHTYNRHMFVVFAYRENLSIHQMEVIPNTAVDSTKSRPALYAQIAFNEKPILELVGVHLKSKHGHTQTRKEQAISISTYIKNRGLKTPKVIAGDFNSHTRDKTFQDKDDIDYFKEILGNEFKCPKHTNATFLSKEDHIQLDHFFVQGAKVLDHHVFNHENYGQVEPFKKYFHEISDHLPVSLKIEF